MPQRLVPLSSQLSSISSIFGSPVLPGESEQDYLCGLKAVHEELGCETLIQRYLAEKVYECLWWLSRYEQQKRHYILCGMLEVLRGAVTSDHREWFQRKFQRLLVAGDSSKLDRFLEKYDLTLAGLQSKAMGNKCSLLLQIDQQVALVTKTISGFQSISQRIASMPLIRERLVLSNTVMRIQLGEEP